MEYQNIDLLKQKIWCILINKRKIIFEKVIFQNNYQHIYQNDNKMSFIKTINTLILIKLLFLKHVLNMIILKNQATAITSKKTYNLSSKQCQRLLYICLNRPCNWTKQDIRNVEWIVNLLLETLRIVDNYNSNNNSHSYINRHLFNCPCKTEYKSKRLLKLACKQWSLCSSKIIITIWC